jgi:hypothetical protein
MTTIKRWTDNTMTTIKRWTDNTMTTIKMNKKTMHHKTLYR